MSTAHRPLTADSADRELAAHLENTPLAVIAWDREGRVSRWTGQAERLFGFTAAEAVGRHTFDLLPPHPDDLPRVAELVADMLAARRPRAVLRNRNTTKDGRVIWCDWYSSVLFDDHGNPASSLSLVQDVTEQVEAVGAAAREEARLRQVLDGARMIGWDWDYAAARVRTTADLAAFFHLPPGPDYAAGDAVLAAVHPDDLPAVRDGIAAAARAGGEFRLEFRGAFPGPDGRGRWYATRGQVYPGAGGAPARIVAVAADVTDRKRAEQEREALDRQLLDAQKWESLGVLAGGVAHDFNNILTVVLGSAGLARRLLPPGSPVNPFLDQIEQASRRAAGLCKEMLAYAGRGPAPGGAADLTRLVRETAALAEVGRTRHDPVRYELAADLPAVRADEGQVRQVLVNLVMNAGEAVADGGEVVVRTALAAVTGAEPADHFRLAPSPGVYVRLDVTDTGTGMTADVLGKLFDPFFTTKFPGRGLGLAAVLGIVKTHRGGIRVDTAPGRGTTFEVYWPPAAVVTARPVTAPPAPLPAVAAPAPVPAPVHAAGGVALVVDDEMYVREVAASTLEDQGYTVLLAADGPGGLDEFRAHRADVRVAVLDVVMPGMTGDDLLAAIRAEAPDLPAVLMSGYNDRRPAARDRRTEFLQKPFHPEDLAAAVARVAAGGV